MEVVQVLNDMIMVNTPGSLAMSLELFAANMEV